MCSCMLDRIFSLLMEKGLMNPVWFWCSLCFMVVSVTPAQYFSRKRGLANGVVYAAGGLGGTVISFMLDALINKVGPPWTFRTIGFLTLGTGLPAAWMIKERSPIRSPTFIEWYVFIFYNLFIIDSN